MLKRTLRRCLSGKHSRGKTLSAMLLLMASPLASADVIFEENFNSGLGAFSASGRASASGGSALMRGGAASSIVSAPISTQGFSNLQLSFDRSTSRLDSGERGAAAISINGGGFFAVDSQQTVSGRVRITLPTQANNASIQILYFVEASSYFESYSVDNVVLEGDGGGNNPPPPPPPQPNEQTIRIQENTTGFCSVDGSVDNNNSGFTGSGFANTDNAVGNAIEWRIRVPASGTYRLTWRQANGVSNRPASVFSNGQRLASNVSFNNTGSFTSWATVSVNVQLAAGEHLIRLQAEASGGLANIDYLEVTGNNPSAVSCGGGNPNPNPDPGTGTFGCTAATGNVTVRETIIVNGGVFDGGCRRYNATSAVGDGSQSEGQDPVFRLNDGATLINVIIGQNGADGIHVYGGGTLRNITWEDIGEDALTIKSAGTVTLTNGSAVNGSDKVFQINAPSTFRVSNFRADNAGKFIRQNGGTTFRVDIDINNCLITNMSEAIARTDSSTSTVVLRNSRFSNIGTKFIGFRSQNITESNNTEF